MGRAAKKAVQSQGLELAKQQGARAGQADQARGATGAAFGQAIEGVHGFTDPEAARLESSTMGAAAEPFAGVEGSIQRNVARTRNSAGASGALAKSALGKSTAMGRAALDTGTAVAQNRQQAAIQKAELLAKQYGIDTNLLANIMGLPVQSLNVVGNTTSRQPVNLGPLGAWG